jgi:DNA-binding CsgD family transcriptional regulator/PAS domain-containing protein
MKRTRSRLRSLDWTAIAFSLAERLDKPTLLLDDKGRIRLFNRAMEELLERPRADLIGRDFIAELVPTDEAAAMAWRLREALAGTARRCEFPVLVRSRGRASLTLGLELAGRGASLTLVAQVLSVSFASEASARPAVVEVKYAIATSASAFGTIRRIHAAEGASLTEAVGQRCYQALHRRQAPCLGCPALALDDATAGTGVIPSGFSHAPFAIVSADRGSDHQRSMTAYFLGHAISAGLNQARLSALAESAGLSEREREVLDLLLLGRSSREIGRALGISQSTVKFHQRNILEKVGADSRFDIFRILY